MAEAPTQSNPNPGGEADPNGGGGTPPATNPPVTTGTEFDPAALTPEQLNQVLEKNPEIWKTERLTELRDKASKYTKLTEQQQRDADQKLIDDKKFEELSTQQAQTIENLQAQIKNGNIAAALTNKLVPLGVVDLEAAIALADKSKITIGEDGAISGVDEVIEALKTGKAYLFNAEGGGTTTTVGTPSNPGNGGGTGGTPKFKRSQLQDASFYKENRDAILKAQAAGQIEDDIS